MIALVLEVSQVPRLGVRVPKLPATRCRNDTKDRKCRRVSCSSSSYFSWFSLVKPGATEKRIRVSIQQPALAAYRVPLFRAIAAHKQIELTVVHGEKNDLPNAAAEGFTAIRRLEFRPPLVGNLITWHSAQTGLARRGESDVLVLSANIRYASLLPALLRARKNGVATVLWGHHQAKRGGSLAEWLRRGILFRLADAVLCYSDEVAESIRTRERFANKVFVAANSLDQQPIEAARVFWAREPRRLAEFRKEHAITSPNLLFVSRIKPRNKLDTLVDVLARLKEKYPEATATIVGAHNDEQERIADLANERGVGDRVCFPGAIYDERELAPWFLSADVFFYPAQIGLSIFHAFGYGLPVIAGFAKNRANPEIEALDHGVNGYRFPEGDSQAAWERVEQLLSNNERRRTMSENSTRIVREKFNIPNMARQFVEAIEFAHRSTHPGGKHAIGGEANRGDRS